MEAQDNRQLALRKAISAHDEAAASLADLMNEYSDPKFAAMLERINENLAGLRSAAGTGEPEDKV